MLSVEVGLCVFFSALDVLRSTTRGGCLAIFALFQHPRPHGNHQAGWYGDESFPGAIAGREMRLVGRGGGRYR